MKTLILFLFFLLLFGENKHVRAEVCVDSSTFSFTSIRNGREMRRTCSWIQYKDDRKEKFCHKTFDDKVVRDECPVSCENCQVLAKLSTSCSDSITYTFETKSKGEIVERKCTWLASMRFRQDKFCEKSSNGSLIKDKCKMSCGNCAVVELDADQLPAHLRCEDSETYEFINYIGGEPIYRNCNWLRRNPSRAKKFCRHTYFGSRVKDECMVSCDNCPSSQPSSGPSLQPTMAPSMAPSSSPSYEPSIYPTTIPTSPPSIKPCLDSATYKFEASSNGKPVQRTCDWLTQREDTETFRLAKFCPKFSNGSYVQDECILSCGRCPTGSPSPSSTPSVHFSSTPSVKPTVLASTSPSEIPTIKPTLEPSSLSSEVPSLPPTVQPSQSSSTPPSLFSSTTPSPGPTEMSTKEPSLGPSSRPSYSQSQAPSED